LAEKGFGKVSPNPMVGAVIVCDDKVIGEGFHEYYGGPHAEVNAIASVQDPSLLERSTMYVSLEPCCHYGKTPPCADLIIEKKIPNVVVCNRDPFDAVDGKGIEKLRAAGVNVQVGVKEDEGRWLNRRFFTFHEQKRPYVILKWAQSADGFLDKLRLSAEESPLKISTPETLALMHEFRSKESAVMVGPNTAIMDDPSLTVRFATGKQPLRVLLDRDLKVPTTAKLYDESFPALIWTKKRCE
jgi:diaminohydroxyphosphoribosylaminopyrimidine deaminase/5-amino-6-(5-phosphoribosylamino)uracil reductase